MHLFLAFSCPNLTIILKGGAGVRKGPAPGAWAAFPPGAPAYQPSGPGAKWGWGSLGALSRHCHQPQPATVTPVVFLRRHITLRALPTPPAPPQYPHPTTPFCWGSYYRLSLLWAPDRSWTASGLQACASVLGFCGSHPWHRRPCFRQFSRVLAVTRACVARTEQLSRSSVTGSPACLLPPNLGPRCQTRGLPSCLPAPVSQDTGCFP